MYSIQSGIKTEWQYSPAKQTYPHTPDRSKIMADEKTTKPCPFCDCVHMTQLDGDKIECDDCGATCEDDIWRAVMKLPDGGKWSDILSGDFFNMPIRGKIG